MGMDIGECSCGFCGQTSEMGSSGPATRPAVASTKRGPPPPSDANARTAGGGGNAPEVAPASRIDVVINAPRLEMQQRT